MVGVSDQSPLRLMAVHAHPDDESSKGAATMARYVDEGVDVLVVTCTGGERGSILNPALKDRPEIEANIGEIRKLEMARAREILGIRQEWLGFVDSGYPEGDPLPPLPADAFGLVPVEVGTEALVRHVRAFRPHVMTTYNEEGGYPHPDHMMCHTISLAAFDQAADPEAFPDAGDPWQPLKLYYDVGFNMERFEALDAAMTERGLTVAVPGRDAPALGRPGRAKLEEGRRPPAEHHDPDPLRRLVRAPRRRPDRARDPGRSEGLVLRGAAGVAARGLALSRTSSWPARWSIRPCPRTTCSPESARRSTR